MPISRFQNSLHQAAIGGLNFQSIFRTATLPAFFPLSTLYSKLSNPTKFFQLSENITDGRPMRALKHLNAIRKAECMRKFKVHGLYMAMEKIQIQAFGPHFKNSALQNLSHQLQRQRLSKFYLVAGELVHLLTAENRTFDNLRIFQLTNL